MLRARAREALTPFNHTQQSPNSDLAQLSGPLGTAQSASATPPLSDKKHGLTARESEDGAGTSKTKKPKVASYVQGGAYTRIGSPYGARSDGSSPHLRSVTQQTQENRVESSTKSGTTVKEEVNHDEVHHGGEVSPTSTAGASTASNVAPSATASIKRGQFHQHFGNGSKAYASPYGPGPTQVTNPAIQASAGQMTAHPNPDRPVQAINGHFARFPPGTLEAQFFVQGHASIPAPGAETVYRGMAPTQAPIGSTPQHRLQNAGEVSGVLAPTTQAQTGSSHQGMAVINQTQAQMHHQAAGAIQQFSPSDLSALHRASDRSYDHQTQAPRVSGSGQTSGGQKV